VSRAGSESPSGRVWLPGTHTSLLLRATTSLVLALAFLVGWMVHSGPQERTAPESVNLAGVVRWNNQPAPRYRPPTPPPPHVPVGGARACTAGDVTASLGARTGAGGHVVRYVRFGKTSRSTCLLQGYPHVTATEPGLPEVTATDGSFFSTPGSANMRPGNITLLGLETDTYCPARHGGGPLGPAYHDLDITLPDAGSVAMTVPRSGGFDVTCGLRLTRFFVPELVPRIAHDPLSKLRVTLEVPATMPAGSTLVYVTVLTNPTSQPISLARCPGYVQTTAGATTLKQTHALNCAPVQAIAAHRAVRYEMRLPISAQATQGSLTLKWALAAPFSATGETTVNVTAP
jgi:hypothetical protein